MVLAVHGRVQAHYGRSVTDCTPRRDALVPVAPTVRATRFGPHAFATQYSVLGSYLNGTVSFKLDDGLFYWDEQKSGTRRKASNPTAQEKHQIILVLFPSSRS